MTRVVPSFVLIMLAATHVACGGDDGPKLRFVAVTFNTGTNPEMAHDTGPDDGYTTQHAMYSDLYYGDGLAWRRAVDATQAFFAALAPDVVGFQEIFHSDDCPTVPIEARSDFVCETWQPGDPTVAQVVVGAGYQVVCHVGHADKCLAVKRSFGSFRGCAQDFCLEGAAGFAVNGCGQGARVARAVIELVAGGTLTVVHVHGTSGLTQDDQDCRSRQVDQIFVDLGDGRPGADGERNLILGDLNTDPGRLAGGDTSAARWNQYVDGDHFHFVTEVGPDAPRTYGGLVTIDHVVSDVGRGECWSAGLTAGHPAVIDARYFDHLPQVCTIEMPLRAP